ncbi:hypothetical protein ABZP36_006890 [Zizania latifolia]
MSACSPPASPRAHASCWCSSPRSSPPTHRTTTPWSSAPLAAWPPPYPTCLVATGFAPSPCLLSALIASAFSAHSLSYATAGRTASAVSHNATALPTVARMPWAGRCPYNARPHASCPPLSRACCHPYGALAELEPVSHEQIWEIAMGLEASACRFLSVLKAMVVDRDDVASIRDVLSDGGGGGRLAATGVAVGPRPSRGAAA